MLDLQAPSDAPVPARSIPSPAPRTRSGLRLRMRTALVAGLSAFVMLAGLVYVFAPPDASVEMSFSELSSAPSYDRDIAPDYSLAAATVADRARWKQVIYGSIEAKGVPVSKATLKIRGIWKQTRKYQATVKIGGKGTFRTVVRLKPGKYRLTLSLKAGKRTKTVSTTRRLKTNHAYAIRVKVRESGIVTFLPVTSY